MTKPNKDQIKAYKEMAKTSPDSMKAKIEANLKATCDKYAGHEDRLDDCIEYLTNCARVILDGKNGDVPDEVCYRICRDYFNDEIWKKEDEKKAKQAAEAAEAKKKEADRKVKLARRTAAKEKKAEALARKKAEEERKAAELKKMQEEAAREAKADEERKKAEEARKADLCPGQMDFFALMGC